MSLQPTTIALPPAHLDGGRALVTGAGRGIGAAAAALLASHGAAVTCADVDPATAAEVAASVHGTALAFDVADPAAWHALLDDADPATAGFDVAVLNAGVGLRKDILTVDDADLDRLVGVNLLGVMRGTLALARSMAARGGGSIVVTASMGGLVPHPQSPGYAATKFGVIGWVRSIARELATHGVRINAVAPALVDTPILGPGTKEMLEGMGMKLLSADDVASALLQALTHEGTGEVFTVQVDRGVTLVPPTQIPGYQHG